MKKFVFILVLLMVSLMALPAFAGNKAVTIGGSRSYFNILDEDAMGSNSAYALATQQSIKSYVESGSVTMTNKTLTSPVINTGISGTAVLDEDAMGSDSATQIATQQSIKAYVDVQPVYITAVIDDVSTGQSDWTVSPIAGDISKVYTVIGATIAGPASITLELAGYPVASGSSTITVASGSTAGTVDSLTPTTDNTVTAGQAIELITDGNSTGTAKVEIVIAITPG